jgi:hypothetical protein
MTAAHEDLLEPLSVLERKQLNALLQRLIEHHFGAPQSSSKEHGHTRSARRLKAAGR